MKIFHTSKFKTFQPNNETMTELSDEIMGALVDIRVSYLLSCDFNDIFSKGLINECEIS